MQVAIKANKLKERVGIDLLYCYKKQGKILAFEIINPYFWHTISVGINNLNESLVYLVVAVQIDPYFH